MKLPTQNMGLFSSRPRLTPVVLAALLAITVLAAVTLPATATAANRQARSGGQEFDESVALELDSMDAARSETEAPAGSGNQLAEMVASKGCMLPAETDRASIDELSNCLRNRIVRVEFTSPDTEVADIAGRAPRGPVGPDGPPPPPPPPPSVSCNGLLASAGFIGTSGPDYFTLDLAVAEVVWTGGGVDVVSNVGPGDTVCTGGGDDTVNSNLDDAPSGSALGAFIDVGEGDDRIIGTAYADTLIGGDGDDWFAPFKGDDTVLGGDGADVMASPFSGRLVVDGGDGNDTIRAWGADSSVLMGGDGNDTIYAAYYLATTSILQGGDGVDYLYGWLSDYPDLGGQDNMYFGGNDVDYIRGSLQADWIWADDGDDVIDGRSGEDYIEGGLGSDRIQGGDDRDRIWAGEDPDGSDWDVVNGGGGNDKCREAEKKYAC